MFSSLEGKARRNFQHCDKCGDLMPTEILRKMDSSYNASVDFRDLNAQLCGLKQGPFETPKDYYDRMVDIGIALEEYHKDRFQPGKLSRIEKECFFAGLCEQSKYLVSHMKDKTEYDPVDMLKELRQHEEARYPANTSYCPKSDGHDRNSEQTDHNKHVGYSAGAANVEPEPESESEPQAEGESPESAYDDGYYIGVINTADELDRCLGLCFNCGRPGHQWHDCTDPLKDSLKAAKERLGKIARDKANQLNQNGGAGVKGAHVPQTNPAKARN